MKKLKWILGGLLVITLGVTALYWEKIQDIRGLMTYAAAFEPENIDENFRTFHEKYSTVIIPNSGAVAAFETDFVDDIFPATYTVEGQEKSFEALRASIHWTGIVVLKEGKLIHEAYFRGNSSETHHIEMSLTKSMTSILFGIARDLGHFPDLNAQVTDFIPELRGSGYDNVTLQQVLDMTTGINFREDFGDLDSGIVRLILAFLRGSVDDFTKTIVNEREPGSFRQYSSINTHVLGWLLRKATGKSYAQLFDEMLWSRVGAESDAKFLVDTTGEPLSFGGANLRLRDLARFGQMMANGGVSMTGERVVSSEWIEKSTTPDTPQAQPGYGNPLAASPLGYKNQWWIPNDRKDNEYLAIGIYGQYLYVNPEQNIVIAINSTYPEFTTNKALFWEMAPGLQAMAAKIAALP